MSIAPAEFLIRRLFGMWVFRDWVCWASCAKGGEDGEWRRRRKKSMPPKITSPYRSPWPSRKRLHFLCDDIESYCLGSAAVSETTRYSYDLPFALNFILSLSSVNSMGVLMGINSLSRDFSCLMW